MSDATRWQRHLFDHILVTVDGTAPPPEGDDVAQRDRALVVVEVPNDIADSIAHSLMIVHRTSELWGAPETIWGDEKELAEALWEAAKASGYTCPLGGLILPVSQDV